MTSEGAGAKLREALRRLTRALFGEGPTISAAMVPLGLLSLLLFTRDPYRTNFIYDEQEALLANPYVRSVVDAPGTVLWRKAFSLDFWGRPPEGTIGSYRPIPNLLWRAMWWLTAKLRALGHTTGDSPFLCHWLNVILHGMVGALLAGALFRLTRSRKVAWVAGIFFVSAAILTEAVSGVVGLADVLCGLAVMLSIVALALPLPWMPLAVFLACVFGLFSKESALVTVVLVPLTALTTARVLHPRATRPFVRTTTSWLASAAALVYYVELRKRLFPTHTADAYLPESAASKGLLARATSAFLHWFAQPGNPHDTINNPLVGQPPLVRVAGGLRVYARGLGQALLPAHLAGDYSAPQEPVPSSLYGWETIVGALLMIAPLIVGGLAIVWSLREASRTRARSLSRAALWGLALMWVVVAFLPVSNLPVVLPTVRAERFWYVPMIGLATLVGLSWSWALRHTRRGGAVRGVVVGVFVLLFGIQMVQARSHANDYVDDLAFWDATRRNATKSAKAHLNYSVMQGARRRNDERVKANAVALSLAPKWPMAHVYMGDALCRSGRALEALPYYQHGFALGPNEAGLIALGLQCLWDAKLLEEDSPHWEAFQAGAAEATGSWYAYLVSDLRAHGVEHKGVDPKYRPRGYNEGPK